MNETSQDDATSTIDISEVQACRAQPHWSDRILPPVWKTRLCAAGAWISGKFGRSAFFPVIVVLALIALIYQSGQLRALAIALTAPLDPSDDPNSGGFAAHYTDLLLWLASCALVVWSWFLFLSDRDKHASANVPLAEVMLMHWIVPLLMLSPFLTAKASPWNPIIFLFLLQTGPLYTILLGLGDFRTWVSSLLLAVAIDCFLHQLPVQGATFTLAATICLLAIPGLFWFRPGKRGIRRLICAIYIFLAALSTAVAPIAAGSVLSMRPNDPHAFEPYGLILSLWWVAPNLLVNLIASMPPRWRREWSAVVILVLGIVACVGIGIKPYSVFGLTTLCLATAMLLAAGSLLRFEAVRIYRHIGAYVVLLLVAYSCWNLSPNPAPGPLPSAQQPGSGRASNFGTFYHQWLAARGETPQQHGPILLVAVAGGGVRAAAHATLSLASADDAFGGKFGDRTLAISAVSGGALGATTWLGQRAERLPVTASGPVYSRTAQELSGFYKRDFVSPTLNRLLAHDFPLGLTWKQVSDRDSVLANAWAASWDELRRKTGAEKVDETIFRRSVAALGTDPRLPIVIFNATSAADGRPALYSSVALSYPGAWVLDPATKVMDAVTDSARFAVVSPVGHACAVHEADPPLHSGTTPIECRKGFDPIAVADGGYNDNSGLASIEAVLDELARYDQTLAGIFVIVIRSNPEVGLHFVEGQRFDKGRPIPELLAPLSVLESARGARSDLLAERLARRLGPARLMVWDLDFAQYMSSKTSDDKGPWNIHWLDLKYNNEEAVRRLQLAPLGWTLDRESFRVLSFQSTTTHYIPTVSTCDLVQPRYATLCDNLPASNSPSR